MLILILNTLSGDIYFLKLDSSIVVRSNRTQFLFNILADVQCFNKIFDRSFCNSLVRTSQCFQRFIRMRISFTAQNRLNSFSHYAPAIIKIFIDFMFIQQQFSKTFQ